MPFYLIRYFSIVYYEPVSLFAGLAVDDDARARGIEAAPPRQAPVEGAAAMHCKPQSPQQACVHQLPFPASSRRRRCLPLLASAAWKCALGASRMSKWKLQLFCKQFSRHKRYLM